MRKKEENAYNMEGGEGRWKVYYRRHFLGTFAADGSLRLPSHPFAILSNDFHPLAPTRREATLHARVRDWHNSLRENMPDPARASPTSFNLSPRKDDSFSSPWGSRMRREVSWHAC